MARIIIDTNGGWLDRAVVDKMRRVLLEQLKKNPLTHTLSGLARHLGIERQCAKRRLKALKIYNEFKRLK